MDPKRAVVSIVFSLLVVGAAFAQSSELSASGGELTLLTKHPSGFSGSFSLSAGTSGSHGGDATLGGTVVPDRVWFFASADRNRSPLFASQISRAIDAKLASQIGDRQTVAAMFSAARPQAGSSITTIPSSFVSLHYTGILSSNTFITGSVSQSHR